MPTLSFMVFQQEKVVKERCKTFTYSLSTSISSHASSVMAKVKKQHKTCYCLLNMILSPSVFSCDLWQILSFLITCITGLFPQFAVTTFVLVLFVAQPKALGRIQSYFSKLCQTSCSVEYHSFILPSSTTTGPDWVTYTMLKQLSYCNIIRIIRAGVSLFKILI